MFRLGRLTGQRGPGLIMLIPGIDRMVRVSLRTVTLAIPPQDVITRDNVTARVDAVAYFRVVDPNSSVVGIEDAVRATSQIAQTTLRSVLGKADLDALLSERERLNEDLQPIIDEHTEPWGIKATAVEIKDVSIPAAMQRAMSRQAEAERERRAKVIHAEGEFQAAARLAQAAEVISHAAGRAAAALPADAVGDRRRPGVDDRLPAADRPDQAAAREQAQAPSAAPEHANGELPESARRRRAAAGSVAEGGLGGALVALAPAALAAVALVLRSSSSVASVADFDGSAFSSARPTAAPASAPVTTTEATTAVKARRTPRGTRGGGGDSSTEATTETSSKRSINAHPTPAIKCRHPRFA